MIPLCKEISPGSMPMKYGRRNLSKIFSLVFLCLLFSACSGDGPSRYDPGVPGRPVGLTATAENGQVTLSWPAANKATRYRIYFATSPGFPRTIENSIDGITGTSYIKTGLTNDTAYYFVVTSFNASGESGESDEVSATPALPGPFAQRELEGTWNFNILVSGAGAGWMRGKLAVDNAGGVTFSSFLDSAGNTLPPAYLFPALFLNPVGHVRDANADASNFRGVMAAGRKMIVGNASPDGASQLLAILQKQVPGITFSNTGDIQGFGNLGGGGRRFIYNQISSGSGQEWEFAAGKIGKDQMIEYTTFTAPSNPAKPGNKASILNIDGEGIVTESLTGALPQPATVIDMGVMSADKTVIVGTATDGSGPHPRFILRIYQLVNIVANDPNTFTPADLAGNYDLHKLQAGASALSAYGTVVINGSGAAAFSSYADSSGATALPAGFSLAIDASGSLSNAADPSFLGKLSYFKEMFVVTGTDSPGACSLSIALKQ
jgi:hypothetical protein